MEPTINSPVDTCAQADSKFMNLALDQARKALSSGEVPVGAVVVRNGEVIGVGSNAPIANHDPTAHAEVVALRAAGAYLGNYRLDGCTLYVTLEPCLMCAGAILQSRVDTVIYAAHEPKTGAAGSALDVFSVDGLNHQTKVFSGLLRDEAAELLRTFFLRRRQINKETAQPLRDDALRTSESAFKAVADYPWPSQYNHTMRSLLGLRLHYLDVGPLDASVTLFCIHDFPVWNYAFSGMLETWVAAGVRVVAPDLIGFGKSDKPKRWGHLPTDFHASYLAALAKEMNLGAVVMVGQGQGGEVAKLVSNSLGSKVLSLIQLPQASIHQETFRTDMAFDAPFPDPGFTAAVKLGRFHGLTGAEMAAHARTDVGDSVKVIQAACEDAFESVITGASWKSRNISVAHQVLKLIRDNEIHS